eukprot:GEMP01003370.1.p1 GENE.GEMP01003370.1~~GEMP01003370.1.p1  ORF type:complete len:447 (+),score=86.14 GEMP01003370.1:21-1361(+)
MVAPLLFAAITAAAQSEKTLCEPPTSWQATAPLEQLSLTLQWKSNDQVSPWWVATAASQFSIFGAPVDGGPLCEVADNLPPQIALGVRFLLCEDCSEGCELSCYPEKEQSLEKCTIGLNSKCIHLEGDIPADIEAIWERSVNPWRIAMALFGALLVAFATPLSRSKTVHMITGAFLGFFLGAVIITWWTWRQAKSTIPFARYYLSLLNVLLVLAPSIGFYLFHTLTPSYTMAFHVMQKFLLFQDPYFGAPVGFLFSAAFVFGGCYLGSRLFGEDFLDDLTKEVKFHIGKHGQRVDIIPNSSNAQVGLDWCLWSLGMIMMLRCSSQRSLNLCWIAFVMTFRTVRHWWNLFTMYRAQGRTTPALLNKNLITKEDFLRQTKFNTEKELTKLRLHLKETGVKYFGMMNNQDRELKLRRFCEGGSHVDSVPSFEWSSSSLNLDEGRRCCVM